MVYKLIPFKSSPFTFFLVEIFAEQQNFSHASVHRYAETAEGMILSLDDFFHV